MNTARKIHKQHKGVENYKACSKCFLPREHESYQTVKIDNRNVSINQLKGRSQEVSISKKYY